MSKQVILLKTVQEVLGKEKKIKLNKTFWVVVWRH